MSSVSSSAAVVAPLFTAEEAERKIEYIQAELARVQHACEYRSEHPYDAVESPSSVEFSSVSLNGEVQGGGGGGHLTTSPRSSRPETSEPSVRLVHSFSTSHMYSNTASSVWANGHHNTHANSNNSDSFLKSPSVYARSPAGGGGGGKRGNAGLPGGRPVLSFSEFERRRIAQLLGRVAVEIAAVWAYVHQCSLLNDTAAGTTPSSTPMNTARGVARQSSERSSATAAPASEHGFAAATVPSTSPASITPAAEAEGGVGTYASPASQLAALNTLIQTAVSIQQMLTGERRAGTGERQGDSEGLPRADKANRSLDAAQAEASVATTARPDSAVPSASLTQRDDNSVTAPPLPSQASNLEQTLPAGSYSSAVNGAAPELQRAEVLNLSSTHSNHSASSNVARNTSTTAAAAAAAAAIPAYLKKYVWEEAERITTDDEDEGEDEASGRRGGDDSTAKEVDAENDEEEGYKGEAGVGEEDDDDATVVVNVDRGDSRSVSAGSATGVNLRSYSRASDALAHSRADSHHTSPSLAPSGADISLGSAAQHQNPLHHRQNSMNNAYGGNSVNSNANNNNNNNSSTTTTATATTTTTTTTGNSVRLQGNAGSIIAHHRFDSDMGFPTSSSPYKRVVSNASLRSSSLIGSPVQAHQQSHPRSHGYSTSSVHSQPLHPNSGANLGQSGSRNSGGSPGVNNYNNSQSANHVHHATNSINSAGRSPDSAEMSPAAAAAYSRSTSLLRRPHRLEVPISRTQSLRRVPSYTSPTSVTSSGGSPPGGAASIASTTGSAFASYAHVPSSSLNAARVTTMGSTSSSNNNLGTAQLTYHHLRTNANAHSMSGIGVATYATPAAGPAPGLAGSPPIALSTSATVDSPPSSVAGLHFKRVISVDSENGGWPPGSLADSLEMSHSKAASLFGRPTVTTSGGVSYSTNVTPPPAPQDVRMSATDGHGGGAGSVRATNAAATAAAIAPTEFAVLGPSASASAVVAAGADLGGASTASSALTTSYVVPGRVDSFRGGSGGSVHSRNLTPYYFPSPTGGVGRAVAAPPTPSRPTSAPQGGSGWTAATTTTTTPAPAPVRPASATRVGANAANTTSATTTTAATAAAAQPSPSPPTRSAADAAGLNSGSESASLPPRAYTINPDKLANFLQCVHELAQTEFSEEEFDSMQLYYFLPGVSLTKTDAVQAKDTSNLTTPPGGNTEAEEPPLPLFANGEQTPVRLANLDVFRSLIERKVKEVCDNAGVPSEPYLSLL